MYKSYDHAKKNRNKDMLKSKRLNENAKLKNSTNT